MTLTSCNNPIKFTYNLQQCRFGCAKPGHLDRKDPSCFEKLDSKVMFRIPYNSLSQGCKFRAVFGPEKNFVLARNLSSCYVHEGEDKLFNCPDKLILFMRG